MLLVKDFDRLITRFRQFGGMRLVWQYAKMGVLGTGVKDILKCVAKGKSFKTVYPIITERIDKLLVEQYSKIIDNREEIKDSCQIKDNREKIKDDGIEHIWFCWLQGIDNAPEMVKICLESQKRMFGNKVVVLGADNYREWVELPTYITEKYKRGLIPSALFTDLLRLELLIRYGGMWIDSSVLVDPTGQIKDNREKITDGSEENGPTLWRPSLEEIWQSELFIFRYIRKGHVVGMSNWLIRAKAGNPLLMDLRDMLLAYWRDYDCTVEYYIFHLFFGVVVKRYPEMMVQMPKGNSYHSIMLGDCLAKDFDEAWWKELTTHVCFHKMNYRKEAQAKADPNSYWNHVVSMLTKGKDKRE